MLYYCAIKAGAVVCGQLERARNTARVGFRKMTSAQRVSNPSPESRVAFGPWTTHIRRRVGAGVTAPTDPHEAAASDGRCDIGHLPWQQAD